MEGGARSGPAGLGLRGGPVRGGRSGAGCGGGRAGGRDPAFGRGTDCGYGYGDFGGGYGYEDGCFFGGQGFNPNFPPFPPGYMPGWGWPQPRGRGRAQCARFGAERFNRGGYQRPPHVPQCPAGRAGAGVNLGAGLAPGRGRAGAPVVGAAQQGATAAVQVASREAAGACEPVAPGANLGAMAAVQGSAAAVQGASRGAADGAAPVGARVNGAGDARNAPGAAPTGQAIDGQGLPAARAPGVEQNAAPAQLTS
ncbi:hypothetical protein ACP70R_006594 [Stipagrostis hirtigluma subsp. patula]